MKDMVASSYCRTWLWVQICSTVAPAFMHSWKLKFKGMYFTLMYSAIGFFFFFFIWQVIKETSWDFVQWMCWKYEAVVTVSHWYVKFFTNAVAGQPWVAYLSPAEKVIQCRGTLYFSPCYCTIFGCCYSVILHNFMFYVFHAILYCIYLTFSLPELKSINIFFIWHFSCMCF
jgi:hypothetical protein